MTDPLHLAINATLIAPGGGLSGLVGYVSAMAQLDNRPRLSVVCSRNAVQDALAHIPGIAVLQLRTRAGRFGRFLLQRTDLPRKLTEARCDVVLSTNFAAGGIAQPQVVHHRNLKHFDDRGRIGQSVTGKSIEAVRSYYARDAIKRARANVFISQYLKRAAENVVGVIRNAHVVYNGIGDAFVNRAVPVRTGIIGHPIVVTQTSSAPHKDIATLLRAFACMKQSQVFRHARLRIIGDVPRYLINRHEEGRDYESSIDLTGWLSPEQQAQEYVAASCAVFTSRLESFGNSPLEAMALGLPTVSVDAGATREVLANGAVICEPGDFRHIAFEVESIVCNSGRFLQLSRLGATRARQFSWTRTASELVEIARSSQVTSHNASAQ